MSNYHHISIIYVSITWPYKKESVRRQMWGKGFLIEYLILGVVMASSSLPSCCHYPAGSVPRWRSIRYGDVGQRNGLCGRRAALARGPAEKDADFCGAEGDLEGKSVGLGIREAIQFICFGMCMF